MVSWLRSLALGLAACLLVMAVPVQGNDDPLQAVLLQAHDLLIRAHDDRDVAQKIAELKQARGLINQSSVGPLGPHRRTAVDLIGRAIHYLKQGDPYLSVNRFIENANRQLGF